MLQVVRYTALTTGIFYGILHRRTLQVKFDQHSLSEEIKKRQHWAEEAKKAWAAKSAAKSSDCTSSHRNEGEGADAGV